MKAPAKIRLLVVGIAGILAILALLFLRSRGWNSNAIACRGGETFEHFPGIETPLYLQRDKAWESDRIGSTGETLGRVGCTVCCLAMGLARFGIQTTPGELNEWLKMHEGYSPRGWLRWETVSKLTAGKVYVDFRAPLKHETIDAALKARQPVLAKVFINRVITHWVLVVGKQGVEYVVMDPLSGARKPDLLSRYSSDVHAIRILKTGE
jgi:hypothetical protein